MADTSAYARVERERRFLAPGPPLHGVVAERLIVDRYLDGTRMRLRRSTPVGDDTGPVSLKLTQKIPGLPWGRLTTFYLSGQEYAVLATLPARTLVKRRLSVPPFGYDVFDCELAGLVLAEAEFPDDERAAALVVPAALVEVTADPRFTGGRLVDGDPAEALRAAADLLAAR
jgi:CYTH domain-containing protein